MVIFYVGFFNLILFFAALFVLVEGELLGGRPLTELGSRHCSAENYQKLLNIDPFGGKNKGNVYHDRNIKH